MSADAEGVCIREGGRGDRDRSRLLSEPDTLPDPGLSRLRPLDNGLGETEEAETEMAVEGEEVREGGVVEEGMGDCRPAAMYMLEVLAG